MPLPLIGERSFTAARSARFTSAQHSRELGHGGQRSEYMPKEERWNIAGGQEIKRSERERQTAQIDRTWRETEDRQKVRKTGKKKETDRQREGHRQRERQRKQITRPRERDEGVRQSGSQGLQEASLQLSSDGLLHLLLLPSN